MTGLVRAAATASLIGLAGCNALASDAGVIGCQAADAGTTAIALHRGYREGNPVMAKVIAAAGVPGLIAVKGLYVWALWRWFGGESESERAVRAAGSAIACLAALHNAALLAR